MNESWFNNNGVINQALIIPFVFLSDIFDAMFAAKATAGEVIIQQGKVKLSKQLHNLSEVPSIQFFCIT